MSDKILNYRNTMLYDGKLYELSIPMNGVENCLLCAFKDMSVCTGKCSSNQHWVESK